MPWRKPVASAHARGYGQQHKKLREQWALKVATGTVLCWRCGYPIHPYEAWDLGHDDYDRRITRGPEHRYTTEHCIGNRKAGLIKAAHKGQPRTYRSPTPSPTGCPVCGDPLPSGRKYCTQRCAFLVRLMTSGQGIVAKVQAQPELPIDTSSRW